MDDIVKFNIEKCIDCVNKPCQNKCPMENDIPNMIKLLKQGEYKKSFDLLSDTTVLPSICGRVCPYEKQCQNKCTKRYKDTPVNIGSIESFIGDLSIDENWPVKKIDDDLKHKKIAVVGGGPAGLTAAAFLARHEAEVVIYERREKLGGILQYGIPNFRLEKILLDNEIHKIIELGVKFMCGKTLGENLTLDELCEDYDAVFLGVGSKASKRMNIPGENLIGVYGANGLLEYNNHPDYEGKRVIISGGGNVALDVARTVKRLGAVTTVIYRKNEDIMTAEKNEVEDAKSEGVNFVFSTNIAEIIGKEKVQGVKCVKTKLENNELIDIEDTEYTLAADFVIMAIGSRPEDDLLEKLNLVINERGYIKIDENYKTSREKVFAGGDLVGEKATVAWAARSGRNAAMNILNELKNK